MASGSPSSASSSSSLSLSSTKVCAGGPSSSERRIWPSARVHVFSLGGVFKEGEGMRVSCLYLGGRWRTLDESVFYRRRR